MSACLAYPIRASGQVIVLTETVLARFHEHRQLRWHQRASGGQLFARFEVKKIVLVEASGPRALDRRTIASFLPNRKAEQREIDERHREGAHLSRIGTRMRRTSELPTRTFCTPGDEFPPPGSVGQVAVSRANRGVVARRPRAETLDLADSRMFVLRSGDAAGLRGVGRVADGTRQSPVPLQPVLPDGLPRGLQLARDLLALSEVHLVGRLATEGEVGEPLVMLLHVESDELADLLDAVERVSERATGARGRATTPR